MSNVDASRQFEVMNTLLSLCRSSLQSFDGGLLFWLAMCLWVDRVQLGALFCKVFHSTLAELRKRSYGPWAHLQRTIMLENIFTLYKNGTLVKLLHSKMNLNVCANGHISTKGSSGSSDQMTHLHGELDVQKHFVSSLFIMGPITFA